MADILFAGCPSEVVTSTTVSAKIYVFVVSQQQLKCGYYELILK
jgi:hypothetical protein